MHTDLDLVPNEYHTTVLLSVSFDKKLKDDKMEFANIYSIIQYFHTKIVLECNFRISGSGSTTPVCLICNEFHIKVSKSSFYTDSV
jgi:low temperature requirement protein LtrA